jgi:hypothetical protein
MLLLLPLLAKRVYSAGRPKKSPARACMTAGSPPLKTPVSLFALEDSTRPELISNSVHIFVYIDR